MAEKDHGRSLLEIIQDLYSRIVKLGYDKRIKSYHKDSSAEVHADLFSPLYDHLHELSSKRSTDNAVESNEPPLASTTLAQDRETTGKPLTPSAPTSSKLTSHLQKRSSDAGMTPEISKTLTKSVWEHIHSAVRLARQGDADTARLHADIANNALKEVSHFISKEQYRELVQQVENEINIIKQQTQH